MDESQVLKVRYEDKVRRITLSGTVIPTFAAVERKFFSLFQIPSPAALALTYIDNEGDQVILGDDIDLRDALILQKLNPLHLSVSVLENSPSPRTPSCSTSSALLLGEDEAVDVMDSDSLEDSLASDISDNEDKIHDIRAKVMSHIESLLRMRGKKDTLSSQALLRPISDKVAEVIHSAVESGITVVFAPKLEFIEQNREAEASPAVKPAVTPSSFSTVDETRTFRVADTYVDQKDIQKSNSAKICQTDGDLSSDEDFIELDYEPSHSSKTGQETSLGIRFGGSPPPIISGNGGKLDMTFVTDVTVLDGTVLEPNIPFTKTWKLSNCGSLPWPKDTRLVHVGGSRLGADKEVNLLFPAPVEVGQEKLISLTFKSPNEAGRYASHWRLVSPSGEKFGNRIWALFEVAQTAFEAADSSALNEGTNPTESINRPASIDHPAFCCSAHFSSRISNSGRDPCGSAWKVSQDCQILNHGKATTSQAVGNEASLAEPAVYEISPQDDRAHLRETDAVPSIHQHLSPMAARKFESEGRSCGKETPSTVEMKSEEEGDSSMRREEVMVHEMLAYLEGMGYMDSDLNAKLLSKNRFMLQPTISDLRNLAEWDPMMEELVEMGFPDARLKHASTLSKPACAKRVRK